MRRKTVQELVKEIVGEDPCILVDDSEESRKALEIVKDFERKYGLEGYIGCLDGLDVNLVIISQLFLLMDPSFHVKE